MGLQMGFRLGTGHN